jgi:DNA-binding MarR family transcriptional regulator
MKLVIGEIEGKLLNILNQYEDGCRASTMVKEGSLKSGSTSQALSTMISKGWVERREEGSDQDTIVLFSLLPLGRSALQAWRVYFEEP